MLLHSTSASASWNAAAVSGRSLPSGDRADRSRSPSGPATTGGPPTSARASRDSGVVAGYGGPPEIGRGAGRGRGEISVGGGSFKKKKKECRYRVQDEQSRTGAE